MHAARHRRRGHGPERQRAQRVSPDGPEASTLHRRDRIGIVRHGNYVSVDTGKYSVAPWLARTIADGLL